MPVWVILVVAGILLVAALVLVVAVHILDAHAEQQCANLHDLSQRSLQNQNQSHEEHRSSSQSRCRESQQLCCVCGNVRNRRSQQLIGSNGNSSSSSNGRPKPSGGGNPRLSTASGLLQPLMDAAYGKKSSLSSVGPLDCLSGLASSSRRKAMVNGLQGGWFNRRHFFRGNSGPEEPQSKASEECSRVPVSVIAAASASSTASASAFAAASRTVAGAGSGDSGSTTTITATITTTSAASSSSSAVSAGAHTSSAEGTQGVGLKPTPQRRLVLEILMSPSGVSDGQGGSLPRATGVRLKLETNASLESLASIAAATSSEVETAFQTQEAGADALVSALTAGLASASCGPVPTYEARPVGNITGSNDISKALVPSIKPDDAQGCLAPMSSKCELMLPEPNMALCMSSMAVKISTMGSEDHLPASRNSSSPGQATFSIPLEKRSLSLVSPSTPSPTSLAALASPKAKPNGHTTVANSSAKAKAKVACCSSSSNLCAVSALSGCGTPSATVLRGAHNQGNGSSMDGLGSLRICVIDGSAKGKSLKDCSKGVTAEIASALAALNVESIGEKGVGIVLALGPGNSSDTPGRSGVSEKVDVVQEEEVPGEGSGSEQVAEEGDEHHPVPEPAEEDECDVNKKEKRKKKNRGRRQKAKAAAVAAAAACIEVRDRPVNGKHCIEVVETSNHTAESEVGCICGTPKGTCHSSGCPYPFTSSGSMVQRKIKEQYDELVRSNVAKTLTLAQVGRFTTCLVEAKSALQQKSDTIQRRFTIAKSLLSKADKSSFDRLCGQIYGLEIEQKKLEEDTVVYNRLQEQLKLSPAYQKMLEYGRTHFELQPNTGQLIEKIDSEDLQISFEELLAQEKRDSFWQKHGPSRPSSMQVS